MSGGFYNKYGLLLRVFLVIFLIVVFLVSFDRFYFLLSSREPARIDRGSKAMAINDFVLSVPRDMLWMPSQVAGSDFWSSSNEKKYVDNDLKNYSVVSLRACWSSSGGVVIKKSRKYTCEDLGKDVFLLEIWLESKSLDLAYSTIEFNFNERVAGNSGGHPNGLYYKEFESGFRGLKLKRLFDTQGDPVFDEKLWNILIFYPDDGLHYYIECPYYALLEIPRGTCSQHFIWREVSAYVSIYYQGKGVRDGYKIMNDVLGYLNSIVE